MYQFSVTPEFLVLIFAGVLALALDYVPGLAPWYDGLDVFRKRQIVAIAIVGIALVVFAGQCFALFETNLTCNVKGGFDLLYVVFLAVGMNQGVHALFKPTNSFKRNALNIGPAPQKR